jgi:hypothetical protein
MSVPGIVTQLTSIRSMEYARVMFNGRTFDELHPVADLENASASR